MKTVSDILEHYKQRGVDSVANINLIIQKGVNKVSVKVDNTSDSIIQEVLKRSFAIFEDHSVPVQMDKSFIKSENTEIVQPIQKTENINKPRTIIQQPEKIGSGRTLTPTIEESVSQPQKKSVITQGGKNFFRCRIYCKNEECGEKTDTYIFPDQKTVCCSKCGTEHKVIPAAPNGAKDSDGKFFLAKEEAWTCDTIARK